MRKGGGANHEVQCGRSPGTAHSQSGDEWKAVRPLTLELPRPLPLTILVVSSAPTKGGPEMQPSRHNWFPSTTTSSVVLRPSRATALTRWRWQLQCTGTGNKHGTRGGSTPLQLSACIDTCAPLPCKFANYVSSSEAHRFVLCSSCLFIVPGDSTPDIRHPAAHRH